LIVLTRLNGDRFVVNAELIRTIEERPDTTIVLQGGETFIVKEKMDEVVARAVEYGRMVRVFHIAQQSGGWPPWPCCWAAC
jgi:flagellar protein FlbD